MLRKNKYCRHYNFHTLLLVRLDYIYNHQIYKIYSYRGNELIIMTIVLLLKQLLIFYILLYVTMQYIHRCRVRKIKTL